MKKILEDYKNGKIELSEVLDKIKSLPFHDLDFAKIDTHRAIRKGFPETIFCQGKSIDQIIEIIKVMIKKDHNILATKADENVFTAVKKIFPETRYNKLSKTIVIKNLS